MNYCDEHLIHHQGQHVESVGTYRVRGSKRIVELCQPCVINYGDKVELISGRSLVEVARREDRAMVAVHVFD